MLTRAYSTFEVKNVDDEQRIIEGIASTPVPDRVGDVMEPKGAKFTLPLPFLWQHRTDQPIGHVLSAKATEDGIRIRAQIAKGILPRIDEAWALIKAGLVRGLSVGFKPLGEPEFNQKTGGYRFASWEWYELSAVTIPANADANIQLIKSCDTDRPPASGAARPVSSTSPGAAGSSHKSMNISEQLTAQKATLKTKSARLEELVIKAAGETLDAAEREERSTITAEVKDLEASVESLEVLERQQARASKAVPMTPSVVPAAAHPHIEVTSPLPKGIEFARALKCKMAAVVSGGSMSALEIAKAQYPDYPRIQHFLKAAVSPLTTADGANTLGTELVYAQNLTSEFIEFLMPQTILGKFGTGNIPSLRRVPFNVRITGQGTGGVAGWVGQGLAKPLTHVDFTSTTLTFAKVAAIIVQSDELSRFSNPASDALIRDALAGAIRERLDIDFVDPDKAAVANVSPASITRGIANIATSGTNAAAVRRDIENLCAPFIAANISLTSGVLIMPNTVALTLSLMRNDLGVREFPDMTINGGSLEGFPVIASEYAVSAGSPTLGHLLILVSAQDIFLSDDGGISVDVSREASLEMETDPNNQVGTVVSMFQNNLIALRAERYINWARRRAAAVAWISEVAYNSGSPNT